MPLNHNREQMARAALKRPRTWPTSQTWPTARIIAYEGPVAGEAPGFFCWRARDANRQTCKGN